MKIRSPRNKTIALTDVETELLLKDCLHISEPISFDMICNRLIHGDFFSVCDFLPRECVDLLIIDPPYNLNKQFNGTKFNKTSLQNYESYIESFIIKCKSLLKSNASIYICCDWQSSVSIYNVLSRHFLIRNRITWEREKGRGSLTNWKNCHEDIWYCTMSNNFTFNVDKVKLKRKVLAPYRDKDGIPKDWNDTEDGNYRLTYPSNLWTDISIPFWSMPENTDHPTQKSEKLIAKLILSSSNIGDVIFDPFCGSGTSLVVAKKLDRKYFGIELENEYCSLTQKRLVLADSDQLIQGYHNGIFWERNSSPSVD